MRLARILRNRAECFPAGASPISTTFMSKHYLEMDVHQASASIAVVNGQGKLIVAGVSLGRICNAVPSPYNLLIRASVLSK